MNYKPYPLLTELDSQDGLSIKGKILWVGKIIEDEEEINLHH